MAGKEMGRVRGEGGEGRRGTREDGRKAQVSSGRGGAGGLLVTVTVARAGQERRKRWARMANEGEDETAEDAVR